MNTDTSKGFEVLWGLLQHIPAHPRQARFDTLASGEQEIVLRTTFAYVQRHVIINSVGTVELFHLDNADRRKSHSRLIFAEAIDDEKISEILTFLFEI